MINVKIKTGGGLVEVPATIMTINGIQFALHKTTKGSKYKGKYTLTHLDSGYAFGYADKKSDLPKLWDKRVQQYGIDRVMAVINSAPKLEQQA